MHWLKQSSHRRRAFWLTAFAAVLASCAAPTDLSAIQTYASTTAQSADSFAAIAADYGASCERFQSVDKGIVETSSAPQSAAFVTTNPTSASLALADVSPQPGYTAPPDVPIASPNPSVSPSSVASPGADSCADEKSVSAAWNDANGTVLNYVQALGNLAGVDAVPSPNPSPFVAGLTAAGVSSAATQAVSGLISSIASYFENRAREKEINTFLAAVNPNMPGAIGALERVDAFYTIELHDEYSRAVSQYGAYRRSALRATDSRDRNRAALRVLRTKAVVESYLASVNQKLRASADYGSAVETILKTHQQLYAASQQNATFADYIKIVQTTGAPAVVDLLALAKAVK